MGKKDLCILLGAVAATLVLALSQFFWSAIPTAAWGLGFTQPGQPPSGPVSNQILQKFDALYLGDTDQKVIYLTFDAGYENGCTEKILDTLKKHNAPAAFFLVGNYIEKNPDLVRRMVADAHIVGNHTMHHPDMQKLETREAFSRELQELEQLFLETTGKELPKYYRPPQGSFSEKNLQMAKELGYKTVFWSLAYADWDNHAQPTREAALQKLLPRCHNGAVVLLHSTSSTNAQILDELLTTWESQGYRFASLAEL